MRQMWSRRLQTRPRFEKPLSIKMRSGIQRCTLSLIVLLLIAPLGRTLDPLGAPPPEYRLRFYHTHTDERLDIVYRHGDAYIPEALAELDHYLRDHRTGEVHHFDPRCSICSTT
jgi:uncharacterized protein YcbK (DUF882 family)